MKVIKVNSQSEEYLLATYQALVDALLPSGTNQVGNETILNGINMKVHEYLINGLNNYITIQQQLHQKVIPLSLPTAIMLDAVASQLNLINYVQPLAYSPFQGGGMFSSLSRNDRIRTLFALENLQIDFYLLPSPYKNNAGLVKFATDALNRFSMFGYYSEWPAYGTTRLNPPDYRKLEFFPPVWRQVGYPGVSLGYRDFRGFLFTMREVKG